jgi:hypothetical protein
MAKTTLSRRTMLRGILGGAGVSIALPLMEAMLNTSGTAHADGTSLPRRLGLFYWGNGVVLSHWTPDGTGSDWAPKSILQPLALAGVKHKVSVVSGLDMKIGGAGHHTGRALMLSGTYDESLGDWGEPTGRTFDQIAADQLQGPTPYRSLELGISRRGFENSQNHSAMSWIDPKSPLPAEHSPVALWNRLFSGGVGEGSGPGALVDARRSVLDVVKQDTVALQARLGATDRTRLEAHLDGIRDLENLLDFDLNGCALPELPEEPQDDAGMELLETRNAVMAKLLAMALACDLTRVFSYKYTGMQTDTYFWPVEVPDGLHTMTHDDGLQDHVRTCIEFMMKELGVLLQELDSIPEGTGTLLDQCGIYCTTDLSEGRTHATDDMPILVCGSAGGKLRTNYHHRGAGETTSMAPLTVMRACGVDVPGFGDGAAYTDSTLTALEL